MEHCAAYEEQISALLDGETTDKEKAEILAHLETCPGCRTYYEELAAIDEAFSVSVSAPSGLKENIMAAIRRTPQELDEKSPPIEQTVKKAILTDRDSLLIKQAAKEAIPIDGDFLLTEQTAKETIPIDEELLLTEQAVKKAKKGLSRRWQRWIAAAACGTFIVGAAMLAGRKPGGGSQDLSWQFSTMVKNAAPDSAAGMDSVPSMASADTAADTKNGYFNGAAESEEARQENKNPTAAENETPAEKAYDVASVPASDPTPAPSDGNLSSNSTSSEGTFPADGADSGTPSGDTFHANSTDSNILAELSLTVLKSGTGWFTGLVKSENGVFPQGETITILTKGEDTDKDGEEPYSGEQVSVSYTAWDVEKRILYAESVQKEP